MLYRLKLYLILRNRVCKSHTCIQIQGRRQGVSLRGGRNGKMSRWALRQPWKRRSGGGGGRLQHIFPDRNMLWQNHNHNGVGVLSSSSSSSSSSYVAELIRKKKKKIGRAIAPSPCHPLTPRLYKDNCRDIKRSTCCYCVNRTRCSHRAVSVV